MEILEDLNFQNTLLGHYSTSMKTDIQVNEAGYSIRQRILVRMSDVFERSTYNSCFGQINVI